MSNNEKVEALGIDFGTSNSVGSFWRNGKSEIIPNDFSDDGIIPSYVYFDPDDKNHVIVGNSAKALKDMYPENVIYNIKRIIGRKFGENEKILEKEINILSYKIINDGNNNPLIEVPFKDGNEKFTPIDISSIIIKKIKDDAQKLLGYDVKKVVITIPKIFTNDQRKAIEAAAKKAGFKEILRVIHEPSSAGIAYGLEYELEDGQKIMVFDLGGGTLDLSILSVTNDKDIGKILEVIGNGGDPYLGGEDFTAKIEEYLIGKGESVGFAKIHSEEIKIELSKNESIWTKGGDEITREIFENLIKSHFDKCMAEIDKTLMEKNFTKSDIDKIILIGGSTKIPKIHKLLKEKFEGKEIYNYIDQNNAVAIGAGILAAKLTKSYEELKKINLLDTCPMSIGIEIFGNKFKKIINKNDRIPIDGLETFTTCIDYQETALFNIYEGENEDECNKNHLMGSFTIKKIPKKKKGEVFFSVLIEVDNSSIIYIRAIESSKGLRKDLLLENDRKEVDDKEKDKIKNLKITSEIQYGELDRIENKKYLMYILAKKYKLCQNEKSEIKFNVKLIKVIIDFINQDIISDGKLKKELYEKFKIYLEKLLMYYNEFYQNQNIIKKIPVQNFSLYNIEDILKNEYDLFRLDIFHMSEDFTKSLFKNYFSLCLDYSCLEVLKIIELFQHNKNFYLYLLKIFANNCINKGKEEYKNKNYKKVIEFLKYAKEYNDIYELNIEFKNDYYSMISISSKEIAKNYYDKAISNNNTNDEKSRGLIESDFQSSLYYYVDAYKYMKDTDKKFSGECLFYIVDIPYNHLKRNNNFEITKLVLFQKLIENCVQIAESLGDSETLEWFNKATKIQNELCKKLHPIGLESYLENRYHQELNKIQDKYYKEEGGFIKYILDTYCSDEKIKQLYGTITKGRLLTILRNYYQENSKLVTGVLDTDEEKIKEIFIFKKILILLNKIHE